MAKIFSGLAVKVLVATNVVSSVAIQTIPIIDKDTINFVIDCVVTFSEMSIVFLVCNQTIGTCAPLEQTIPCVAVIDEWENHSITNPLWVTFPTNFTTRPFCLVNPTADEITSYYRVL